VKDDNAFAMLIYVVAALFQEAATTRTAATGRHTAWPQSTYSVEKLDFCRR
jgi:hypothetical protein